MSVWYDLSAYCESILTKSSSLLISTSCSTSCTWLSFPAPYHTIQQNVQDEKFSLHKFIIYISNWCTALSTHKKMWNDIHHLHAIFFCVLLTLSCSCKYCHILCMYNHLHHYKSPCGNCNCPCNKMSYYTSHNSIPKSMLYVMNMMKIKIYTK